MAGRLRRWWYGDPPAQVDGGRRALTAAATSLRAGRDLILPRYETWQDEAWAYWQELGELYYGVRWLSEMLSRVRLVAATVPEAPGDEPALLETAGTPKDLVARFGGGLGGQSELVRRLAVQLAVPGEGWLVGEPASADGGGEGEDRWSVRSADEIRRSNRRSPGPTGGLPGPRRAGSTLARLDGGGRGYNVEVVDEHAPPGREQRWRVLPRDALVVRVWNPHDRRYREPDSPVRHALATARKLQLANRYIQAQFLSRLASAGLLLLPDNVDFPVSPEFEGQPDAVIKEWLAIASTAINNPGSAAAVVPILLQLPPDVLEKVKHVDFTTAFDEKALDKREAAVRELATIVDLPAEVLLGMGEVNHWGQWQIEESGIKVHIAPRMEAICHAFTDGWYRPMLEAAGEDPTRFLVWYDPSEITVRPDKSEKALQLYDRGEASGDALRRESGMDEGDQLERDDLEQWALRRVLTGGNADLVAAAFKRLTGTDLVEPAPAAAEPGAGNAPDATPAGEDDDADANERREEPGTREEPPPPPGELPTGVAAGAEMASPRRMQRRDDGWHVWNLTHWLKLPDEQTPALDRRYLAVQHAKLAGNGTQAPASVGDRGGG